MIGNYALYAVAIETVAAIRASQSALTVFWVAAAGIWYRRRCGGIWSAAVLFVRLIHRPIDISCGNRQPRWARPPDSWAQIFGGNESI